MTALPQRVLARAVGRLWSRLTEETDVSCPLIPVLCYHSISDDPAAIAPARFAAQMRWLRRHGYRAVGLDEVLGSPHGGNDDRRIVITFDDGLADVHRNALPALVECRLQATIFFPPALAGSTVWYCPQERAFVGAPRHGAKRLEFMSWDQADRMAAAGMSFQSHGWSHARLTALGEREIAEELSRSRQALEQRFGAAVRFLSYPFGDFDRRVQRVAASLGYEAALTTVPGFNHARSDRHALRRVAPSPDDDLHVFACKLSPLARWYYRLISRAGGGG